MYQIDNSFYDIVLEDEDIIVLENVITGEPLTMDRNRFWNLYSF